MAAAVAPPLPAAPQYVNYAQQAQQDAAYLRTVRGDGKPADPKVAAVKPYVWHPGVCRARLQSCHDGML